MNWIIAVAIAVISDSLIIFTDNYSSDVFFKEKGAVSQKILTGFVLSMVGLITIALNGFDFIQAAPLTIILLVLSGIMGSIAGIPYFKALEIDDSTNIGIFFQFSPILYLLFGWIIDGNSPDISQVIASFIILSAPILIVLSARKRSRKIRFRAAFYAFICIVFYVSSGELFIQASDTNLSLFSKIGLVLIAKGLSDLIIIGSRKKWRHRLTKVIKTSRRKVLLPIFTSVTLRSIQEFSYRTGLVMAPTVAIASAASDSIEPIAIFFMGLFLTLIWPKFGREKLQKKVVLVHLIATVIVVVGIVVMQL